MAKEIDPAGNKVILFYYRPDGKYEKWGLWLWKTGGDGAAGYAATKGKAVKRNIDGQNIAYWDISTLTSSLTEIQSVITAKDKLNFIVRSGVGDDWKKDPNADLFMPLADGKHFMVISNDTSVYSIKKNYEPSLVSAAAEGLDSIKLNLSVKFGLETENLLTTLY